MDRASPSECAARFGATFRAAFGPSVARVSLAIVAFSLAPSAEEPRPLVERIGAEGPLDNDTEINVSSAAVEELARGDTLARKATTESPGDVEALAPAFEAWRRALVLSTPDDLVPVGTSAREALHASVEDAVAARLVGMEPAPLAAAFAARFEGLANQALADAGDDVAALARVERENPGTVAAARAALRRFDLLCERGARAGAAAVLAAHRAGSQHREVRRDTAPPIDDERAALNEAWRRRDAFWAARFGGDADVPTASLPPIERARLVAHVEWPGEEREPDASWRRVEPGLALEEDGDAWISSGDELVHLARAVAGSGEPQGPTATPYALDELARPLGAVWLASFGDATRPWSQRPARSASAVTTAGTRADGEKGTNSSAPGRVASRAQLALVAGRARDERGNALIVLDLDGGTPRARWCRGDEGFAHVDGRRADESRAPIPGLVEYQPGPIVHEDLVIVGLLAFGGDAGLARRVDESRSSAWVAAFDLASGDLAWKRELARGADGSARDLQRLETTRGVTTAWLPLAATSQGVLVVTELGVAATVRPGDGAFSWLRRLRRAPLQVGASDVTYPAIEVVARETRSGTGPGSWNERFGERASGGSFLVVDSPASPARFVFAATDSGALRYTGETRAADGPTITPERVEGLRRLLAPDGTTLCERDGRLVLERRDPRGGARVTSSPFPLARRVRGAIVIDARHTAVAVGADLLVFDAERDLLCVARVTLPGLEDEPAIGLQVRGRTVYGAGRGRAWIVTLD